MRLESIGRACSGKKIYHFRFVLLCILGETPLTSPPGDLYLEGQFNGGCFHYDFGGLIFGGAYFRNFTVCFLEELATSSLAIINTISLLMFTPTTVYML